MAYQFGPRLGSRGGMGFGFRGSSPPWPYVGRGRGGLPRCGYFFAGGATFTPQMTQEQELTFLKGQAAAIKQQLEQIEARIRELEAREE